MDEPQRAILLAVAAMPPDLPNWEQTDRILAAYLAAGGTDRETMFDEVFRLESGDYLVGCKWELTGKAHTELQA